MFTEHLLCDRHSQCLICQSLDPSPVFCVRHEGLNVGEKGSSGPCKTYALVGGRDFKLVINSYVNLWHWKRKAEVAIRGHSSRGDVMARENCFIKRCLKSKA